MLEVNVVPSTLSIAKELVRLSRIGEGADPLTHLRLQKLLYYTQAWSLVTRQSELFEETLEAWRYGPVVTEVREALPKNLGSRQVEPETFTGAADLGPDEAEFVEAVWEEYKDFTAYKLRDMTHNETPWVNAWGGKPLDAHGHDEIAVADLEEFFSRQTMSARIAAYDHECRKREEEARVHLATRPGIDVHRFAAMAARRSDSAS